MTIRVFYNRRGFFGNWDYCAEDYLIVCSEETLKNAVKKCFSSFPRVLSFSFRLETDNEMYLIEQTDGDARGSVYTVTHVYGLNRDVPVKMSAAAIRKLARDMLTAETEAA